MSLMSHLLELNHNDFVAQPILVQAESLCVSNGHIQISAPREGGDLNNLTPLANFTKETKPYGQEASLIWSSQAFTWPTSGKAGSPFRG